MQIAVLIPTYNRPVFLEQACRSLLNQSHQDWHAYVADDGSDVMPQPPADPRFTFVHYTHGGLARNLNRLLRMWEIGGQERATWLGDDDILLPTALEQMIAHQTADVVFSDLIYTDMKPLDAHFMGIAKGSGRRTCDPSRYTRDMASFHDNFNMGTAFMSRKVLDAPRFDTRFTTGMEDGLWLYGLFLYGCTFDHFPIVTKYYRIHEGNNSNPERMRMRPEYERESALIAETAQKLRMNAESGIMTL